MSRLYESSGVMGPNVVLTEFLQNPIPFCGGFVAGLLRLNVSEDPLRSWLEGQGISPDGEGGAPPAGDADSGPQSISID